MQNSVTGSCLTQLKLQPDSAWCPTASTCNPACGASLQTKASPVTLPFSSSAFHFPTLQDPPFSLSLSFTSCCWRAWVIKPSGNLSVSLFAKEKKTTVGETLPQTLIVCLSRMEMTALTAAGARCDFTCTTILPAWLVQRWIIALSPKSANSVLFKEQLSVIALVKPYGWYLLLLPFFFSTGVTKLILTSLICQILTAGHAVNSGFFCSLSLFSSLNNSIVSNIDGDIGHHISWK